MAKFFEFLAVRYGTIMLLLHDSNYCKEVVITHVYSVDVAVSGVM